MCNCTRPHTLTHTCHAPCCWCWPDCCLADKLQHPRQAERTGCPQGLRARPGQAKEQAAASADVTYQVIYVCNLLVHCTVKQAKREGEKETERETGIPKSLAWQIVKQCDAFISGKLQVGNQRPCSILDSMREHHPPPSPTPLLDLPLLLYSVPRHRTLLLLSSVAGVGHDFSLTGAWIGCQLGLLSVWDLLW